MQCFHYFIVIKTCIRDQYYTINKTKIRYDVGTCVTGSGKLLEIRERSNSVYETNTCTNYFDDNISVN